MDPKTTIFVGLLMTALFAAPTASAIDWENDPGNNVKAWFDDRALAGYFFCVSVSEDGEPVPGATVRLTVFNKKSDQVLHVLEGKTNAKGEVCFKIADNGDDPEDVADMCVFYFVKWDANIVEGAKCR